MHLSLSVRIAEAACKTKLNSPLSALLDLAVQNGYRAVCMRASGGGIQTPLAELRRMHEQIAAAGLKVSMVTVYATSGQLSRSPRRSSATSFACA